MELSVGEVAKRAALKVSTLHFYEQKGLIYSSRNQGNQRRYQRNVIRRIAVIKAAQEVGLTLEEIAISLSALPKYAAPNRKQWEQLANNWNELLEHKIQQMRALQRDLGGCIGCGCLSMKSCPLYNLEDHLAKEGTGAVLITQR